MDYKTNQHRFQLLPNTASTGSKQAYLWFGFLVVPLLGTGLLLQIIFQLEFHYLVAALAVVFVILFNLYTYYNNSFYSANSIFLLLDEHYVQIVGQDRIYFQETWSNITLEWSNNGPCGCLAVNITSTSFRGIRVGVRKETPPPLGQNANHLQQPDYWLVDNTKEQFIKLLHQQTADQTVLFDQQNYLTNLS